MLFRLHRVEELLGASNRALKLDAAYAPAWVARGFALYALQRDDEALYAFEEALRIDPASVEAVQGKTLVDQTKNLNVSKLNSWQGC